MKELSEKEIQYKKIEHILSNLSIVFLLLLFILVVYTGVAIKVFTVSYLYLAIGLPIVICLVVLWIFIIMHFVKKKKLLRLELYGEDKELKSTNPIFKEIIDEYYHNQLEYLDDCLPKNWKVFDLDDHNNTIFIYLTKRKTKINVEVHISESEITTVWEDIKTKSEFSERKSLTVENFIDLPSVMQYISNVCENIGNKH